MAVGAVFYDAAFADVRTREVLEGIEPLIRTLHELPNLLDNANPSPRSGQELVEVFNYILREFLQMAKGQIAECPILSTLPDLLEDLRSEIQNCEAVGVDFSRTACEFVVNSGDLRMRQEIIQKGEDVIRAVACLLIRADLIGIHKIHDRIEKLRGCAQNMKQSDSNKMVEDYYQQMCIEIEVLQELTKTRVKNLRYPSERDDLRSAFAEIRATAPVYFAATKAFVRHPDQPSAQNLRDQAYRDVDSALVKFAHVAADGSQQATANERRHLESLAFALDKFQDCVIMDPMQYEPNDRKKLENLLEDIVKKSGRIAEEQSTRDERKEQIINSCNKLRQALQDLLTEYESGGRNEEELDLQEVLVNREIKDLRRHLRRAVVDAVSDAFLDSRTPLQVMIRAAKNGDFDGFDDARDFFSDHAQRMLHAAELVCEMSSDETGNQMIRYACEYIRKLEPQVISAAELLLSQPDSKIAQENMDMFKKTWLDKVRQLTCAVDAIMNVDDFLAVSEKHIEKDAEEGLAAIYHQNRDMVDRMAGAIRGRALRICDVVEGELFAELSVSPYFEDIKMATKKLRMDALETFAERAEQVIRKVPHSPDEDPDMDMNSISEDLIEACGLVRDAVTDIRHALLKSRNLDDVDSDNEYEEDGATTMAPSHVTDGDNQQKIFRRLPEEHKEKIQQNVESFKLVQHKFETEVAKWDESGNDIVILAKRMCHLMANMMDYTRGRGPYRTTRNVIDAAQEISTDGKKLITLARLIGDECVQSSTKTDLLGYLEQIDMLSTQLNITSKVKADIEIRGDEVVVGNLDSITQLIQNAKNLLNAVVKTVKSAYIASTKYQKKGMHGRVQWQLAPPQKHPLVRPETQKNRGLIRKASERKPVQPLVALNEYHVRH
ncbi:hypothetical protein QR680_004641 [Steinernema hermaphroditum]|uniref:Vinculin n=1 Tax=Steinernema hermaphroditum TaxID=289476 RepID=A0AA39HQH2_9BILA|nr:hypothetical protein QR680_004641 [Steinernema hermaphroditum]